MNVVVPVVVVPRRRRWTRVLLILVALVIGMVIALPTIVSSSPKLRDYLVRNALADLNGDISIGSLSIGWMTPLAVADVSVRPHQGDRPQPWDPALTIERIESERTLLGMLFSMSDLGGFRIERPVVFVHTSDGRNNYRELFKNMKAGAGGLPEIGVSARLVDGTLRWENDKSLEPWQIAGINLGVGLRAPTRSQSGRSELLIEHGKLLDRAEISVGLCDDLLKFVAPVVASAARARGRITIDLDDWRLPWGDMGSGELGGRIVMHTVDIGPGPMVSSLYDSIVRLPLVSQLMGNWRLPTFIEMARESTVPFKMLPGGKIHHENLRFSIADLVDVQTAGIVGLDESLDLTAALGIHPPNPEQRYLALLRQLTTTPWPVRIHGSLGAPLVDASPLGEAWKKLLFEKVPADWLSGRQSLGTDLVGQLGAPLGLDARDAAGLMGLIRGLVEGQPGAGAPVVPGVPVPTPPTLGPPTASATPGAPLPGSTPMPPQPMASSTVPGAPQPVPPGVQIAGEAVRTAIGVMGALRERREAMRPPPPPPPQAGPSPTGTVPPAGLAPPVLGPPLPRRPLRNGLRMLLEGAEQATQPQPPPPPTPSATPTATAPR